MKLRATILGLVSLLWWQAHALVPHHHDDHPGSRSSSAHCHVLDHGTDSGTDLHEVTHDHHHWHGHSDEASSRPPRAAQFHLDDLPVILTAVIGFGGQRDGTSFTPISRKLLPFPTGPPNLTSSRGPPVA